MGYHLIVGVETAVVKIGCVEIGIAKRRCLEQSPRAHVMLPVIEKGSRRYMAAGAAHGGIMWKRLGEQRFAATFRLVNRSDQPAAGTQARIGQKVDILDIGDDSVEDGRGRLGACELIDDDVANEIA